MNNTETKLTSGINRGRTREQDTVRARRIGNYSYCEQCGQGWTGEAKAKACCKPIKGYAH